MKMLTKGSIPFALRIWAAAIVVLGLGSHLPAIEPGKVEPFANHKVATGVAPSDWLSIRAAYEAQRHAAFAVAGGYQARNPGQRWRTKFDARGFTTEPDAGAWRWGLELQSYGFTGQRPEEVRGDAQQTRVEGQRVTYQWSPSVREWFVNDPRGLEHGFTIQERPRENVTNDSASSILNFWFTVRGGLRPELAPDGSGVRFDDEKGNAVVHYGGLKVWDAAGTRLPARFVPTPEGICLSVDERGAHYPITIDPIAQQAYLKASNTGERDYFGYSVAISGDTVVVGAPYEASKATGVNNNDKQSDNSVPGAGAAYVFVRNGDTWTQQAYLKASNTPKVFVNGAADRFGFSVAISGDTIVVGAPGESSDATGINGPQSNDNAPGAGAAYVFVRSGTDWVQQAYLKAPNTGAGDNFGFAVAISGNTVAVGAPAEDSGATGVGGNQNLNNAPDAGAVYVFTRGFAQPDGVFWTQQYLKASDTAAGDAFGSSVAIAADTIVVGAPAEDTSGNDAGAAYVFLRGNGGWAQQALLKAANAASSSQFGYSVAISADTIAIGAPFEDGVGPNTGAAYVFLRSGATWAQQAYLKASSPGNDDEFGSSVAISGGTVAVGAPAEDSKATGINGSQTDNSAIQAGAAYIFMRSGATWTQRAYVKASNTGGEPDPVSYERAGDQFGFAVALEGDTLLVGAVGEDGDNNGVLSAGAGYIFTGVAAPPMPTPTPTPAPTATPPAPTPTATVTPTPTPKPTATPGLVANVSTRLPVGRGDNVLIEGFIVLGPAGSTKKIIVRAVGPSLAPFGITDALANPTLEIHNASNATIATNNDWKSTQVGGIITGNQFAEINGSGLAPSNNLESAIIANLAPGSYTAVVRGAGNTVGTGVVDAYDLSAASPARVANVATRGLIQPGDKLMIAGFIIQKGPVKAVVRAIGPSLSAFGITNALPDTTLQLRNQNGVIVKENDNWKSDPAQKQELESRGLQPSNDLEAALIATLQPGHYTAQVRGKGQASGIGVAQLFFLQ